MKNVQNRRMGEILSVRLNDPDMPDRAQRFEAALRRRGASASLVVKELVDAYIRSTEAIDPTSGELVFPVAIVAQEKLAALQRESGEAPSKLSKPRNK